MPLICTWPKVGSVGAQCYIPTPMIYIQGLESDSSRGFQKRFCKSGMYSRIPRPTLLRHLLALVSRKIVRREEEWLERRCSASLPLRHNLDSCPVSINISFSLSAIAHRRCTLADSYNAHFREPDDHRSIVSSFIPSKRDTV